MVGEGAPGSGVPPYQCYETGRISHGGPTILGRNLSIITSSISFSMHKSLLQYECAIPIWFLYLPSGQDDIAISSEMLSCENTAAKRRGFCYS